ncbi:MAG: glycerol-3-phosphate dehydrogenase [Betaproteobacteria bacterium]|nr:glycerol-3-phosphate dehydrogenase [Betaproteobacteria bacterium]
MSADDAFDLVIIGGGINGAGIARDAAGRGLKVLLCEKGDIACATSSTSSKLIHGGLRYLEHYALRLVSEALSEREILLRSAPHLVRPLRFVLPRGAGLRPAWMIRIGLFLYDRIGGRRGLEASSRIRLRDSDYGAPLKEAYTDGFVYSDCVTDDARLVVETLLDAAARGATVAPRTALTNATPKDSGWEVTLEGISGTRSTGFARVIVNATGPWVEEVLRGPLGIESRARVRLVKGSHVVVPRLYARNHAYILQNPDQRVVFLIPFEDDFTLIGTTDVPLAGPGPVAITPEEAVYLCQSASRFLKDPVTPADVVWSFAGIRALHDDGSANVSEVTRDYVLQLDRRQGAPALSVFGGKLTTYRRLAERVLDRLAPLFPGMGPAWTAGQPLPGGGIGDPGVFARNLVSRHSALPAEWVARMAHRYGARSESLIGNAVHPGDLGRHFGAGLYAREIDFLLESEWATTADDILWRRTKAGLKLSPEARRAVADHVEGRTRLAGERACAR